MGIFDDLKRKAGNLAQGAVNQAANKAAGAVKAGIANAQANPAPAGPGAPVPSAGGSAPIGGGSAPLGSGPAPLGSGPAPLGGGVTAAEGKTSQGYASVTITFDALPASLEELRANPLADLKSPFGTAALTVAALNAYEADRAATHAMLNYLRGPRPMSPSEEQFLRDRLVGKMYVPRSYFAGTSPANSYTPSLPYSVTFFEDPYSYQNAGYCRLNCISSGADSPRQVMLRKKESTGEWFLWENYLLPDIRIPAEADPWA